MKIRQIAEILDATVLAGEADLDHDAKTACGSDMMSDVLAFVKDQSVLLTGLINPQVMRTADMMDIVCIVFVRGKQPDPAVIEMAEERGIVVLATKLPLFTACGKLYPAGLSGGGIRIRE